MISYATTRSTETLMHIFLILQFIQPEAYVCSAYHLNKSEKKFIGKYLLLKKCICITFNLYKIIFSCIWTTSIHGSSSPYAGEVEIEL